MNIKETKLNQKSLISLIALLLVLSTAIPLASLPIASATWDNPTQIAIAAGMKWDFPGAEDYNASATRLLLWERYHDKIPTVMFGTVSPNPVGVGQDVTIVLFNPVAPPCSVDGATTNDVRWEFTVTITDPDGVNTTLPASGTIKSDSTGAAYTKFTPNKVGNYSITCNFPELLYRWYDGVRPPYGNYKDYYGVTFLASSSTYNLIVQQDPVYPTAITTYPLPTEYWTRPIEGQNTEWARISSNWYNNAHDKNYGSYGNQFQPDGTAPNSAHILWTKTLEDGGVVGGTTYFQPVGETFNVGSPPYYPRFQNQIIMHGRLYYEQPSLVSGTGGGWLCVDLKTGETLWGPKVFPYSPSFGYYYDWDTMNVHGVFNEGYIFATSGNNWYSIEPRTGTFGQLNITNVPGAAGAYTAEQVIGPKGEILRYVIQNAGTTTNPDYRLLQWNSSKVFPTGIGYLDANPTGGTLNAGLPSAYDWNISLPIANTLRGNVVPLTAIFNDVLLCYNGTLNYISNDYQDGGFYHNPSTATFFSVSLKPESRGQTLFGPTNIEMTKSDGTWLGFARAGEGVFVMVNMPGYSWVGYSMYTGEKLWETAPETEVNPLGYYSYMYATRFLTSIAYGKFYSSGYAGHVFGYDLQNGSLLWTYAAPTNAEIFDYYTVPKYAIADGKIYIGAYEHTPDTPLYKGNRVRCVNATTGEEIWSMLGYPVQYGMAIADGVLVYWNEYDAQVYAVGKGPSAMTVTAPDISVELGHSVTIKGTVTDISAGTKQNEQAARFPNGLPAVSDESMGPWMEYVYMQKPRPTNTTGVQVDLSVIDANGNYRTIGTTTTVDGTFALNWKPDIEGTYTVYASFAGTESYWPSHAVTYFSVDAAEATPTPQPTQTPSAADLYFLPAVIGIIIAIIVVGAVLALLSTKKP